MNTPPTKKPRITPQGINIPEEQASSSQQHSDRPTQAVSQPLPQWIRLPRQGQREFYTGLSRSSLIFLCIPGASNGCRAKVKSYLHKSDRHNRRGTRHINLPDLLAYMEQQSETQNSRNASLAEESSRPEKDQLKHALKHFADQSER